MPARALRLAGAHALAPLALSACALAVVAAGCGSSGSSGGSKHVAKLQTIRFQRPKDPGPQPFTPPADVSGPKTVQASGPFGGTGSNQVCDRDLLIRFLKEHPDRMREWARVEGIDPSYDSVSKYIAKLHPVTLTRDTQVTNHTFINGHAVGFQAILQAGTAVLVDKYGRPVARCRCGNPLTPALHAADRHLLQVLVPLHRLRQEHLHEQLLQQPGLRQDLDRVGEARPMGEVLRGLSRPAPRDAVRDLLETAAEPAVGAVDEQPSVLYAAVVLPTSYAAEQPTAVQRHDRGRDHRRRLSAGRHDRGRDHRRHDRGRDHRRRDHRRRAMSRA